MMTAINKRLLISESRGDSNRCIPCRKKPDQHDAYVSHTSPHTLGVRFLRAVPVHGNLSRDIDRFRHISLLPRKRATDTIHSTSTDRSVAQERNWVWRIGQSVRCGLCREHIFSGAVTLSNSVDDS
jgi:hypothetical protein